MAGKKKKNKDKDKDSDNKGKDSSKESSLDPLKVLDDIWVELLTAATDMRRRFSVRDKTGTVLFYGSERVVNFRGRGRGRRFQVAVLSAQDYKEVMSVVRKEVMIWCCCFCSASCLEQIRITTGKKEKLIGSIDQVRRCYPGLTLNVADAKGKKVLKLKGPTFKFSCCGLFAYRFDIFDSNGKLIGKIEQDVSSVFAHHYHISFPSYLDVKLKGILLGVCFLLVREGAIFQRQLE